MSWATARKAPSRAYLLFDPQPAINTTTVVAAPIARK